MKRNIIFIMIVTLCFFGCEKKKQVMDVSQEMLNQSASNQAPTELTLMQEGAMSSSMHQVQKGKPANAVSTTVPQASGSLEKASEAVTSKTPTAQEIQQALKNANVYSGKIDGDLGSKTKAAIREFQQKNGLKADGKVGPKTWAKLQPYLNQATEPSLTGNQD